VRLQPTTATGVKKGKVLMAKKKRKKNQTSQSRTNKTSNLERNETGSLRGLQREGKKTAQVEKWKQKELLL